MNNGLPWTLLMVLQFLVVIPHPVQNQYNTNIDVGQEQFHREEVAKKNTTDEKIISVRITSSVAVGRQKDKSYKGPQDDHRNKTNHHLRIENTHKTTTEAYMRKSKDEQSELPPDLTGANIEFIKQLNAKKGIKDHHLEHVHPFQARIQNHKKHDDLLIHEVTAAYSIDDTKFVDNGIIANSSTMSNNITNTQLENLLNINQTSRATNETKKSDEILVHSSSRLILDFTSNNGENDEMNTDETTFTTKDVKIINNSRKQKYNDSNENYDTIGESSMRSFSLDNNENIDHDDNIQSVPLARSVSFPGGSQNYINNIRRTTNLEREPKSQLTSISFSIIHDAPNNLEQTNSKYDTLGQSFTEIQKPLDHPIVYSEPAKIYSEPAKFYSEPSKIYSEPAKIYSEPAKVYSEPAKVYSEPAKIYSEPAKFYSEPASLNLPKEHKVPTSMSSNSIPTTPVIEVLSTDTLPTRIPLHQSERNYELDKKLNIQNLDLNHGVQETSTEKCQQDNCKVGYVVEGRQFKKYRVEERTSDGFIVGEYGVVRNEDGALRGVRYTADSEASPRLIYDALMKFLQLR